MATSGRTGPDPPYRFTGSTQIPSLRPLAASAALRFRFLVDGGVSSGLGSAHGESALPDFSKHWFTATPVLLGRRVGDRVLP